MASEQDRNVSDEILQAALNQAFSPPPSRRQSVRAPSVEVKTPPNEVLEPPPPVQPPEQLSNSEPTTETWKIEYEAQVEAWRAQSSEAREKAEKERERWEALRAREREELLQREAAAQQDPDAGWETVSHKKDPPVAQPTAASENPPPASSVNSGHSSAGGINTQNPAISSTSTTSQSQEVTRSHSQADTADESQKWEDIQSSMTSSLPSMTFPERTETPPPPSRRSGPIPTAPLSTTLSVFDPTLSKRTRMTAFFSSLTINLLLPFVNGVMLGFGEIFAKNIVMGWLGWKSTAPGYIAATTGIVGAGSTPWSQQQKQRRP